MSYGAFLGEEKIKFSSWTIPIFHQGGEFVENNLNLSEIWAQSNQLRILTELNFSPAPTYAPHCSCTPCLRAHSTFPSREGFTHYVHSSPCSPDRVPVLLTHTIAGGCISRCRRLSRALVNRLLMTKPVPPLCNPRLWCRRPHHDPHTAAGRVLLVAVACHSRCSLLRFSSPQLSTRSHSPQPPTSSHTSLCLWVANPPPSLALINGSRNIAQANGEEEGQEYMRKGAQIFSDEKSDRWPIRYFDGFV